MDDARIQRILRQHVWTDRLLGVEAVAVSESAAVAPPAASREPTAAATAAHVAAMDSIRRTDASAPAPVATPQAAEGSTINLFGEPAPPAVPAAPVPPAPAPALPADALPAAPVYAHRLDAAAKMQTLEQIDAAEVRGCNKCVLCERRTQTVFGEGDANARLMFVGEAPGETEDLQGRPFVGRAGDKLNEMIKAMGLARQQVYIANVVKCRPPNNRPPQPQEIHACWDYLRRQIQTIQPLVVVTLGAPATKTLLGTDRGITTIRGTWHQFAGLRPAGPAIPVMPTFHPAYLLRAYTPENRRKVWSDLQKVVEFLQAHA